MSEPSVRVRARALARFFTGVTSRLLAEVREQETLPDSPAVEREWTALTLYACVRGIAERGGDDVAELVDAFHDELLSALDDESGWRAWLAGRYSRYDGLVRTLGPQDFAQATFQIARAGALALSVRDPESFAATVAPLLESLAEGAAATSDTPPAPTLPPIEPLLGLTRRLDAAGLRWAVGASGLLASLGLVDEVNDWDIQLETSPGDLRMLFQGEAFTFHGHGGCHADWKLSFEAERTELISHFAFFVPGGIVKIPLHVSGEWNGMPIAGLEAWACAYWLMGQLDTPELRTRRAGRAESLFGHLRRSGAKSARIEELLEQPLPSSLAARLVALPRS